MVGAPLAWGRILSLPQKESPCHQLMSSTSGFREPVRVKQGERGAASEIKSPRKPMTASGIVARRKYGSGPSGNRTRFTLMCTDSYSSNDSGLQVMPCHVEVAYDTSVWSVRHTSATSKLLRPHRSHEPIDVEITCSSDMTTRLPPSRTGFDCWRSRSQNFVCGNRPGQCAMVSFLGDLPFPQSLHSGTAPYSPRFAFVGSQVSDDLGTDLASGWLLRTVKCSLLAGLLAGEHVLSRADWRMALQQFAGHSGWNSRYGAVSLLYSHDKIDFKRVYTELTFAIGSKFIRHTLDDSAPIADLQGNKKHISVLSNAGTGRGGAVDRLLASHLGEPGSIPSRVAHGFSHEGTVPCRTMTPAGGSPRGSPVPPLLHSGAAPCSPHFTFVSSQYLDVQSRPNLTTPLLKGSLLSERLIE
ncbi:hypothetical protein PR048_012001 [Dryococelus australis]|uniref:Uncharacterized protein n=1 Tax=Dryococelus australis TaxID=614101 RepID=A0ABQ9HNX4_9NEOP|nr:hypothetical protein PR048_012001 [Dryococelus australis]